MLTTMLKERKSELHRLIAEAMEQDQNLVLQRSEISGYGYVSIPINLFKLLPAVDDPAQRRYLRFPGPRKSKLMSPVPDWEKTLAQKKKESVRGQGSRAAKAAKEHEKEEEEEESEDEEVEKGEDEEEHAAAADDEAHDASDAEQLKERAQTERTGGHGG